MQDARILMGRLALAAAALGLLGASAAKADDEALDKVAMHVRLVQLAGEIDARSVALDDDPSNADLRAQLEAAIAERDSLSSLLGGDRPTELPPASRANPNMPASPEGSGVIGGRPSTKRMKFARTLDVVPVEYPVMRLLAAPATCTSATQTATNSTPVTIGTAGAPTVSSSIAISGANTHIWNVRVTTFIQHTFAADLDVTIASPAGTVVTLTTDNGGSLDNVFNGTVWSDQAGPGLDLQSVVTDRTYLINGAVLSLSPEEGLGAFFGEDPNGTWTLTINDDAGGDTGQLTSWSLEITALEETPTITETTFTNSTPIAMPNFVPVFSNVAVAGVGETLAYVKLGTGLLHATSDQIDLSLISPSTTIDLVTTDNGGSNDNVFNGTQWYPRADLDGQVPYSANDGIVTDSAYADLVVETPLTPEEPFGVFLGENPNGTWTLAALDDSGGTSGLLTDWSLTIATAACSTCRLTCGGEVTATADPEGCGVAVSFPLPTPSDNTCGNIVCSPASGSAFGLGTTTVTCTADAGATCSFDVTVIDETPPSGGIIIPELFACIGPGEIPVNVADNFADNCDSSLNRFYYPGSGPFTAEGDYAIGALVWDDAFNFWGGFTAFSIDLTPPTVAITSPATDQTGSWPLTNTTTIALDTADNDAAFGGPIYETIELNGCLIYDGGTEGDGDGLLSDELIQLKKPNLCQLMSRCHFFTLEYPTITVRSYDRCGNASEASRILRRRFVKSEVCN